MRPMSSRFRRSETCDSVSEGGLEPLVSRRVDLQERHFEHEQASQPEPSQAIPSPVRTPSVDRVNIEGGPSRDYWVERIHGEDSVRGLLVVAAFWLLVGVIVVGALCAF